MPGAASVSSPRFRAGLSEPSAARRPEAASGQFGSAVPGRLLLDLRLDPGQVEHEQGRVQRAGPGRKLRRGLIRFFNRVLAFVVQRREDGILALVNNLVQRLNGWPLGGHTNAR